MVKFVRHRTTWAPIVGALLTLVYLFFGSLIAGIYSSEADVHQMAFRCLRTVLAGLLDYFPTLATSGICNAYRRSMTSFKINSLGLLFSTVLDSLLIFVCHLGVIGAVLATPFSQLAVCVIPYYRM